MSQVWNLRNQNYTILDKLASFSNSFAISSGNKIIGLDTTRDVVQIRKKVTDLMMFTVDWFAAQKVSRFCSKSVKAECTVLLLGQVTFLILCLETHTITFIPGLRTVITVMQLEAEPLIWESYEKIRHLPEQQKELVSLASLRLLVQFFFYDVNFFHSLIKLNSLI